MADNEIIKGDQVVEETVAEQQLDEFKASGEDSSVADPVTPQGGSTNKRKADKEQGDKATQEVPTASTPGQTKTQLMAGLMMKASRMPKGDLEKMVAGMAKQPKAGVAPSEPMQKLSVKEDVQDIFAGQEDLGEEFIEKAETIFEAAINARLTVERTRLEEEFETKLQDAVAESQEQMSDKVDAYLTYCAEEWMRENEVAIESALRVELADNLIEGMKQIFAENYIDVPEEKVDLIDELTQKVDELEDRINEEVNRSIELNREVEIYERAQVFAEVSEGLTDVQADKFDALVEGLEAEDTDQYRRKLEMIKENYFARPVISEQVEEEPLDDLEEDKPSYTDPEMAKYAEAISRTVRR